MNINEWKEEGKPTNTPFYIRWDPDGIRLTKREIHNQDGRRIARLREKFISAYVSTTGLYGAVPVVNKNTLAASEDLANVDYVMPGVFMLWVMEEVTYKCSFIGWMAVPEAENGTHENKGVKLDN